MKSEKFKETFEKIFKDKKMRLIALAAVAGVALLLLGNVFTGSGSQKTTNTPLFDNDAYNMQFIQNRQQELQRMIQVIDGVGRVQVEVSLETGVRYVYATNDKSSSDGNAGKSSNESTIIVVDGQNGKEPIVLMRIEPTIQGVVVVCDGADNVFVKQAIIEAVTRLCGISANRVSVAKMAS